MHDKNNKISVEFIFHGLFVFVRFWQRQIQILCLWSQLCFYDESCSVKAAQIFKSIPINLINGSEDSIIAKHLNGIGWNTSHKNSLLYKKMDGSTILNILVSNIIWNNYRNLLQYRVFGLRRRRRTLFDALFLQIV